MWHVTNSGVWILVVVLGICVAMLVALWIAEAFTNKK